MKTITHHIARRSGFSLIEVLIAVVILSVGLLALAALQINVVRSTADAKSRSAALSLAQEKLEQIREFRARGSDPAGCPSATVATWPEEYLCIADGADAAPLAVGGTNYSRTWTVNRFMYDSDPDSNAATNDATFVAIASDTVSSPAGGGSFVTSTEFKRVDVNVGWTDAEGVPRTVTISDSVSVASPSESSRARAQQKSGVRRPEVLIRDPSLEEGVIPIAIGGGTDTAATNPRPEVGGRDGDLIETRFDIYTYKGAGNDNALVQSRVETVVVGCTCEEGSGISPGYRPTVWSGNRYVAPVKTGSTPPARHASNTVRAESQYCDVCCRDHHDSGFSGPKFSPRRGSHAHTVINGEYQEACRLIRVDGIMRVAADPYADYFNLLATDNNANDPYPSSAAEGHYQDMVLDYLDSRVVTPSSGYNNALSDAAVAGFELANSINDPAQISVQQTGANKWLHSRGLYFDWLESDAISIINDAKANCDLVNSSIEACVLVHVPFTSINLSELARWASTVSQLRVTNGEFKTALNQDDPVRGLVSTNAAVPGSIETITSEITYTTAGLAVVPAINADDTVADDTQEFRISGGPPPAGSHAFNVNTTGYTYSNSSALWPTMTVQATNGLCDTASSTSAIPYTCSSESPDGVGLPLVVTGYNYGSSTTSNASLTCTGPFANKTYSSSYTVRTCNNYEISSATGPSGAGVIGAASPSDGVIAESTTITFPLITNLDTVTLGFTLQGTTTMPSTCTYTCSRTNNRNDDCQNANSTVFEVTAGSCP